MSARYQTFVFKQYEFDRAAKQLTLRYGFDDAIEFVDTYHFGFEFAADIDLEALDRACFGLFMMAGISYYKAFLPPTIVIQQGSLTAEQAEFFGTTYRSGLGELYVRNQLIPPHQIVFPADRASAPDVQPVEGLAGVLLPLGGGKDSLVSAELLRAANIPFSTWTVNHSQLLQPLIHQVGSPHLPVERWFDPQLFALNDAGAYNGHVPVSAIFAFAAVVTALLAGKQDIVLSNEASAGEMNLDYHGLEVNHQYSKTLAFERDFQHYVASGITPSVRYFSFLRPLSELYIAELFCTRWFEKYHDTFMSCNRSFRHYDHPRLEWCGECPKCAFVFLVFAPFVPKAKLIDLFGGRNLFESPKLETTYRELLGIQGHKPFDCVGEVRECRQAVQMALATGEYPELERFVFPPFNYDYHRLQPDVMPEPYRAVLQPHLLKS